MDGGAWWDVVQGVAKSRTRLSDFTFTFHFHALEKEMATHSSVLAWRTPGVGEPGGLPSMGSHRVGHNWSDLVAAAAYYIFIYIHTYLICIKMLFKCFLKNLKMLRWLMIRFWAQVTTSTTCFPNTLCFCYLEQKISRMHFWIMKWKIVKNGNLKIKMRITILQFRLSIFVTASDLSFSQLPSPITHFECWVFCDFLKYLCDGWRSMQWSTLSDSSHLSPNAATHPCHVSGSESCLCFWQNVTVICHHLIFTSHQIAPCQS